MKISLKFILISFCSAILAGAAASCEDGQSYADLLNTESKYVNNFLVDQRVIGAVPPDSIFETGPDAPYYQLDGEGNIYMQVINPGWGEKAETNQRVYFRFMRYNLAGYKQGEEMVGEGNEDDMAQANAYFDYDNFSLPSSSQYGTGIQMPLHYLPLNCEVNIIIKSQYGFTNETSYVQPYLYHIRYFKSEI